MASFRWRLPALLAVLLAALVLQTGLASAQETRTQGIGPRPPTPTGVVVNLPARTLYWYVDGKLVRTFPVGIGKTSTQTPIGSYKVQYKAVHPWWQPPSGGKPVPPGPANPLGTRWIGFNGGYGIHGNNNPASIGQVVSLGCIRMYIPDVEWLYDQVSVGTPVHISYEPVQVQYGSDGRTYLAVYADVYGGGSPSAAKVLGAAGLDPDAAKPLQPGLYRVDATVLVNGGSVPAILTKGRAFVPARELGNRLAAIVTWDPDTRTVTLDGQPVTTVLKGSTGYVDVEQAAAVLGVEYSWNAQTNAALLTGQPLFLNGHLLNRQGRSMNDEVYLPVRAVGEAAGHTIGWDNASRQALIDGEAIATTLYRSRAFAPAGLVASGLGLGLHITGGTITLQK